MRILIKISTKCIPGSPESSWKWVNIGLINGFTLIWHQAIHDDVVKWKLFGVTGPCITNVIATCRKNFSQWESSFLWKLRCYWLKFLRRVAKTLVIQGPGPLWGETNGIKENSQYTSRNRANINVMFTLRLSWHWRMTNVVMLSTWHVRSGRYKDEMSVLWWQWLFITLYIE